MQGRIVVRDLLENGYTACIADLYKEGTQRFLDMYPEQTFFSFVDLRDMEALTNLIRKIKPNVVVNCAEGDWNLNVYHACLETNTHVLDLGSDISMTREQLAMDPLFKKQELTAITGCGSTPGINNMLLHHARGLFDTIQSVDVGFAWDSNIKKFVVPFSIQSILEEFTDAAPIIVNGEWIEVVPLEHIIEKEFREIGKQQCFFVRHPETYTFYASYHEDGLKSVHFYAGFPQHSFDTIHMFIESGLGSKEVMIVDGKEVIPLEVLTRALRNIVPPEGYLEKENLWVDVEGEKDGQPKKVLMECIVDTLPGWEDAGCNIDTGIPASIMGQMVYNGLINERGSFAPGSIVPKDEFFDEIRKRGMVIYENGVKLY